MLQIQMSIAKIFRCVNKCSKKGVTAVVWSVCVGSQGAADDVVKAPPLVSDKQLGSESLLRQNGCSGSSSASTANHI